MGALVSFLIVTVAVYPVSQDCLVSVAVTPAALAGARLTITGPSPSASAADIRANSIGCSVLRVGGRQWSPRIGLDHLPVSQGSRLSSRAPRSCRRRKQ